MAGIIVTVLLLVMVAFLLFGLVDYISKYREQASKPLSLADAECLAGKLAQEATNLVTGKYCALVCDEIKEIEDNFLQDLERIFNSVLRTEHIQAAGLSEKMAAAAKDHLLSVLNKKDCENCEERSERVIKKTKRLILEILMNKVEDSGKPGFTTN